MSNNICYDVIIVGAGVAGAFAAYRAATCYRDAKVLLIDLGRPPGKRRRQLEGWLGCFPGSDGKLYLNDKIKVSDVVDGRKVRHIEKWVMDTLEQCGSLKATKDKLPSASTQKKFVNAGFELIAGDYIQWKPESVHLLSRLMSEELELNSNIDTSFDNEVSSILKQKNKFLVSTPSGDYVGNKLILAVGRSGWRWANDVYKKFGMDVNDDYAKFGIRLEIPAQYLKDFNKSTCTWQREDMTLGPFQWYGTVIPEDHADLVISAFRSNEDRWKTDKVVFNLIGNRFIKNSGVYETDRLGKLTFLLFNDRIGREKVRSILKKESQLSQLPEYNWLIDSINEVSKLIPEVITRGYFHAPTINPITSSIRIGSNLETEVDNMFVAGESSGITGILSAAITGAVALDSALK